MKSTIIFIISSLLLFVLGSTKVITRKKLIKTSEDFPYIIGGVVVNGREFPGQISLLLGGNHHCGASIINENYILTAAHCDPNVFKGNYTPNAKSSELIALSGTNSLSTGGTRHTVTEIHAHEDYNPDKSWHNDIAVMRVVPPFRFGVDTKPVSLPTKGQGIADGTVATVIGWGSTEDGVISEDLLKVNLQVINLDVCKMIYEKEGFEVFPQEICANTPEGQKGPCEGDSGGPLFVNGQVVGLVSWSQDCGLKEWPSVYTRVSSYIDWINSNSIF